MTRAIHLIVIHCSATRVGKPYPVERLEADHKARGFLRAGYHFYVRHTGEVIALRPIEMVGAHARGHNAHSVGVCYEGGLDAEGRPRDTRTPAQRAALLGLVGKLRGRFPGARVVGHRDLSPDRDGDGRVSPAEWVKACPSFDASAEYGPDGHGRA